MWQTYSNICLRKSYKFQTISFLLIQIYYLVFNSWRVFKRNISRHIIAFFSNINFIKYVHTHEIKYFFLLCEKHMYTALYYNKPGYKIRFMSAIFILTKFIQVLNWKKKQKSFTLLSEFHYYFSAYPYLLQIYWNSFSL